MNDGSIIIIVTICRRLHGFGGLKTWLKTRTNAGTAVSLLLWRRRQRRLFENSCLW